MVTWVSLGQVQRWRACGGMHTCTEWDRELGLWTLQIALTWQSRGWGAGPILFMTSKCWNNSRFASISPFLFHPMSNSITFSNRLLTLCVCTCVHAQWRPEVSFGSFLRSHPPNFLRQSLSLTWNLTSYVGCWPVSPKLPPTSISPELGLQVYHYA